MPIELPDDLREFAEQHVKSGRYRSVVDVVRDAFDVLRDRDEKVAALRDALDQGIAQLDAGDYVEGTARELAHRIREGRRFEDV
jgi:putative addiction module CopG family antidote